MQRRPSEVVQNQICNGVGQMVFEWQARENDNFFRIFLYRVRADRRSKK
jgi:hypothetical protein